MLDRLELLAQGGDRLGRVQHVYMRRKHETCPLANLP